MKMISNAWKKKKMSEAGRTGIADEYVCPAELRPEKKEATAVAAFFISAILMLLCVIAFAEPSADTAAHEKSAVPKQINMMIEESSMEWVSLP